jgi:hypothetical protein
LEVRDPESEAIWILCLFDSSSQNCWNNRIEKKIKVSAAVVSVCIIDELEMKQSINSCEYFLTGTDSKHELYSRFHNLVGPWYIHFLVRHTLLLLLLLAGWLVVFFTDGLLPVKGKINSSPFSPPQDGPEK